jgi:hypothetical protein
MAAWTASPMRRLMGRPVSRETRCSSCITSRSMREAGQGRERGEWDIALDPLWLIEYFK